MNIRGREFIADLEPLRSGGIELSAELHERPDHSDHAVGKVEKEIYLTDPSLGMGAQQKVERNPDIDGTRLSYLAYDQQKALFVGMLVERSLRGAGIGRELFRYFKEHIENEGLEFVGTAIIHKPLLALVLTREGLRPKSNDCKVEVLPDIGDDYGAGVPVVRFVKNDLAPHEIKDRSRTGMFYETAPEGILDGIPVESGRVVALHTGYYPARVPARTAA